LGNGRNPSCVPNPLFRMGSGSTRNSTVRLSCILDPSIPGIHLQRRNPKSGGVLAPIPSWKAGETDRVDSEYHPASFPPSSGPFPGDSRRDGSAKVWCPTFLPVPYQAIHPHLSSKGLSGGEPSGTSVGSSWISLGDFARKGWFPLSGSPPFEPSFLDRDNYPTDETP